ncbi:MAG: LPS export ABC transporter permease LptG [Amphritea sp.]
MLNRLDIYIGKQVLGAIFIVLLIVVGLDILFSIIDLLGEVNERFSLMAMLEYQLMITPKRFYEFIPLSSLVGCLIGLGTLATNSELTVMRAAGVSIWRIVGSVLKPVVMLAVIALLIGEFVVPITEPLAESHRAIKNSNGAISSGYGVWHREDNEYVHINAVMPNGVIRGVTRYQFAEDNSLTYSSFASDGIFKDDIWTLNNVKETRFLGESTEVSVVKKQLWDMKLTPQRLAVVIVAPEDLSMTGLWSYTRYLNEQGLDSNRYLLAFWGKLLQPLSILGLVLIAVSFIFGPLRSVTTGQRIIAGIVVGVVFKFIQDLLAPASSLYNIPPEWAALTPIVLCILFGSWLLKRAG